MTETTVSLGKGQKKGKYSVTPDQIMGAAARSALRYGLGDEGAKAVQAVLHTEGGMTGDVGDLEGGGSYGPTQLYWGGQLNNLAAALGVPLKEAAAWVQAHPLEAVDWSVKTYLGGAVKAGLQRGLRGADLATYAQRHGQVSVSPERAGASWRNLFGSGEGLFGLGASRAEAAELDSPDGGSGVDDRPPSSFDPPARLGGSPTVLSPNRARIKKQLDAAHGDLPKAQQRYDEAKNQQPDPEMTRGELAQWQARRNAEVNDADRDLTALQKKIDDLETQDAKAQEDEQKAADKAEADRQKALEKGPPKQPAPIAPGSPSEQFLIKPDGTLMPNPNYKPPTPKPARSRTYEAGGARITEQADEAGGFQPMPSDAFDPNTQLTAAQSASLPIQQQNANSSSVSAAASMLHAQVAKGQLDYNQAKTIFDYIVAQRAPVEEGGKLYDPGRQPSSKSREFFGLPTREYSAVDAAGFFGKPELNQYVRGPYPFGAGPMSADEYHQRQNGTYQGQNQMPAPVQPQAAQPMPSSSAGTMMAAQQGGGFQPMVAPTAVAQAPAQPAFGAPSGPLMDLPPGVQATPIPNAPVSPVSIDAARQNIPAGPLTPAPVEGTPMGQSDPDVVKIRATLIAQGVRPEVAERAARHYLGIP